MDDADDDGADVLWLGDGVGGLVGFGVGDFVGFGDFLAAFSASSLAFFAAFAAASARFLSAADRAVRSLGAPASIPELIVTNGETMAYTPPDIDFRFQWATNPPGYMPPAAVWDGSAWQCMGYFQSVVRFAHT